MELAERFAEVVKHQEIQKIKRNGRKNWKSEWSEARTHIRTLNHYATSSNHTYIVLGQQVERTKHLIILKLEALGSLEVSQVCAVFRVLRDLFRTPLSLVLLLTVGILSRRDARTPTGSAVVVVRVHRVGGNCLRVVRSPIVEV